VRRKLDLVITGGTTIPRNLIHQNRARYGSARYCRGLTIALRLTLRLLCKIRKLSYEH